MNYFDIFEELRADNSRLYKEQVMAKYSDDDTFKSIFFAGLDPFTNYYIRKIPVYQTKSNSSTFLDLKTGIAMLDDLKERKVTGHAGIAHLKNILENLSEGDAKIIEYIIKSDFRCGVSRGTINRTWPDLIAEYPVMLCEGLSEKTLAKMVWPAIGQLKSDGMRANLLIRDSKVDLLSRSGKSLEIHSVMDEDALKAAKGRNVLIDGELVVVDENGNILPRSIGNGICNKAVKGTITKAEAERIRFVVWDIIPIDVWLEKETSDILENRMIDLEESIEGTSFILAETEILANIDEAHVMFQRMLAEGKEGIILKNPKGIWENKRSAFQIKFKAERSADLLCIGWEYGTGKNANKVGNLILESSDGVIEVSVGSGLSDEDREKNGDYYLGKVIEITYNERIKSKGKKKESLFLPRFNYVREDKTTANSSEELK